ncbi:MAG TPA: hypothetical protein VEZ48_01820 [Sphingomonadaceae bacterium]|nr:hypothetical protein [Sphingomonadaceae bacterium]
MLGLGIALRPPARAGFDPATLIGTGTAAIWLEPSDLRSMSQDAAGTVPAAVDAPVGRIADRSGRGHHATQGNAAFRPILRREADGRLALEFDGVDDFLVHAFGVGAGDVTLSCAAQRTGDTVLDIGLFQATPPGAPLRAGIWAQAAAPQWGSYIAGAFRPAGRDIRTRAVMTVVGRAAADTQRMLTNGGAAVEMAGSYAGDAQDRRAVGREFSAAGQRTFRGRLYTLFGVARALDGDDLSRLVRHQAAQAGVTT